MCGSNHYGCVFEGEARRGDRRGMGGGSRSRWRVERLLPTGGIKGGGSAGNGGGLSAAGAPYGWGIWVWVWAGLGLGVGAGRGSAGG